MTNRRNIRWTGILLLTGCFLLPGTLSACGRDSELGQEETVSDANFQEQDSDIHAIGTESVNAVESDNADDDTKPGETDDAELEEADGTEAEESESEESEAVVYTEEELARFQEIRDMFGEDCIAEQTYEVELSEYEGKVWFVPFLPTKEDPEYPIIKIIQDGEVIWQVRSVPFWVPKKRGPFTSLDDVYFGNLNYDGYTDILLIESYGDIQIAKVYYGFDADAAEEDDRDFDCQYGLERNIYFLADQVTVPWVVDLLTNGANGKSNGEFTSWQEAYAEVSRLHELENRNFEKETEEDASAWERQGPEYDLVDIDGDDIPELAAGKSGYYVSLYTYRDGSVYQVMNDWPYGAGGNSGYYYLPGENRLLNYNTGYAGFILYTTYMTVGSDYTIESETVKMLNFNDLNGNGVPDSDEEDTVGGALYRDGVEITEEEYERAYASWKSEDYEHLSGGVSYEEFQSLLSTTDDWQP